MNDFKTTNYYFVDIGDSLNKKFNENNGLKCLFNNKNAGSN